MKREYVTHYSNCLQRDMHILIHGDNGLPLLVFPTQDSMCTNFEDFGMIDTIADYIESGQVQVFTVDTVDKESWSDLYGDGARRANVQESYYHYIVDEVVPFIAQHNPTGRHPVSVGTSLGATHAGIVALRRPDLFNGCIAMSGIYDASCFTGGWMNSTWYDNSPVHFLQNMPPDHHYVDMYNHRSLIFCVGQGAWEANGIRTLLLMASIFQSKGINAWCDFWGYDVNHDWPWWKKQIRYFLPKVLDGSAIGNRY
ncbi:MAG: alpha/beta hydrolase-fold protein [Eubacteriales bacterium]|nr:alpha/beta hydrolase-fold protein [Eubacteriales bacterium]